MYPSCKLAYSNGMLYVNDSAVYKQKIRYSQFTGIHQREMVIQMIYYKDRLNCQGCGLYNYNPYMHGKVVQ